MNGGGLRKRRRPDPSLPRDTVRDTSISFRALGALLWIMDRPDGWTIRADQMAKDGKRPDGTNAAGRKHRREGREAIRTALLDELAAAGYYRLERRRMLDGSIKMGTAASEDPVDSWAAQYAMCGRNAVPMVEQADGTFLVQYPDGTLGTDDCDPPEMPGNDSADEDESAGHTGDGFLGTGGRSDPAGGARIPPVPRNPAPVEPAPATPASGEPASDNTSPLGKEEDKGFEEKDPPPTPLNDTNADDGAEVEGEGEDPEKNPTLDEIVAWFTRRRPDWEKSHPGAIREALSAAIAQELGDLRTAAAALRELAEGKHGDTGSPRRLLHAEGRWWANVRPRRTPAEVRLAAGPKCDRPCHERQPADGCALCAGEVNACPDCPRSATRCEHVDQPAGDVGEKGAAFLPRHLRQRTAEAAAESVAS